MAADPRFAPYLDAWRERYARAARERAALERAAREAAVRAARALRGLGARRVRLFGSLARPGRFEERSDIDLATEGLPPERLTGAALREAAAAAWPFPLDVRAIEEVAPEVRAGVLEDGEVLE